MKTHHQTAGGVRWVVASSNLGHCPSCYATMNIGTCHDLFHTLLALDHQRVQPWGSLHGLHVACFYLQHPDGTRDSVLGGMWQLVDTYLTGGPARLWREQNQRIKSGRDVRCESAILAPPPRRLRPLATIHEVSVDGTFPAGGHGDRARRWAQSVAAERAVRSHP